ncbi:MAG: putative RNA-binding protein containing Zn ribbon [Pedosphaera sp.]|jgi:hypothetical protein|nr:putative RNA-binding protein containing Zn ribbon [Pedosphaera sp.]
MAIIPKPYRKFKLGAPRADSRQKVLAQWRGIDLTPIEKARALHVRTAGDLMPGVLKELRIDRRRSEAEVLKVWNNLIDPTLVAHAQPTGLHKGTLFVTVDSSVWLDEIVRYRRKEILDRLHHSFGRDLIARISFRVG